MKMTKKDEELLGQLVEQMIKRAAEKISREIGEDVKPDDVWLEPSTWGYPYFEPVTPAEELKIARWMLQVDGEEYNMEWGFSYRATDCFSEDARWTGPHNISGDPKAVAAGIGNYRAWYEFEGDVYEEVFGKKAAEKRRAA